MSQTPKKPDAPGVATTNWATDLVKKRKEEREARKRGGGTAGEGAESESAGGSSSPSKLPRIVAAVVAVALVFGGVALALR